MTRNLPQHASLLQPTLSLPDMNTSSSTENTPSLQPGMANTTPPVIHDNSDNEWDHSDPDWDEESDDEALKPPTALPTALQVGASSVGSSGAGSRTDLPSSLKPGPAHSNDGAVPRKSHEIMGQHAAAPGQSMNSLVSGVSSLSTSSQSPPKILSYNPFLRPQKTGDQIFGTDRVWANEPSNYNGPAINTAPIELPTAQSPTEPTAGLSFNQHSSAMSLSPTSRQAPLIPIESEWDTSHLDAPARGDHALGKAAGQSLEENVWTENTRTSSEERLIAAPEGSRPAYEGSGAPPNWYSVEAPHRAKEQITSHTLTQNDDQPASRSHQQKKSTPGAAASNATTDVEAASASIRRQAQEQKVEHYQIKQIRWHDAYSKKLRTSPILIQNANGPCPLLALVNALVLSTPVEEETGLVEALRTREQVSLGLLLDAVFEELMSNRRGSSARELPDVGELYAFLLTLHTGMNVNPRFVFTSSRSSAEFHPALREYSQPGSFEETKEMRLYSTFNVPLMHGWLPTRDSAAYAAFDRSAKNYDDALNIQFYEEELEHKLEASGLTPQEQDLFEDLLVIKDFLATWPTQLTDHGLKVLAHHLSPGQFAILFRNDHFSTLYKEPRSQQLLTVVTDAGYSSHEEIVWESLVDVNGAETEHFSGDFRPVSHNAPSSEPGPAGPRNSSLSQHPVQSMLDVDQGWSTVTNKRNNRKGQQDRSTSNAAASSSSSGLRPLNPEPEPPNPPHRHEMSRVEQEDADLALALQLQEEEDSRDMNDSAARRRAEDLSHQFIEQDARGPRPVNRGNPPPTNRTGARAATSESRPTIPPRRNNNNSGASNNAASLAIPRTTGIRVSTNPTAPPPPARTTIRANTDGDEAPPPSYEQAAKGRPFHPPVDHPASPLAPVPSGDAIAAAGRQGSAYLSTPSNFAGAEDTAAAAARRTRRASRNAARPPLIDQIPPGSGMGQRRRSALGPPVGGPEDRERCSVM